MKDSIFNGERPRDIAHTIVELNSNDKSLVSTAQFLIKILRNRDESTMFSALV